MLHETAAVKGRIRNGAVEECYIRGKEEAVKNKSSPPSNPKAKNTSPSNAFDLSRHPLVTFRLGSAYSSADWNRILFDLTAIVKRGPFALIIDMRGAQMPNAVQRRSFIAMYEQHDRLTRTHFLVLGVVGDSTLLQGVITALNWLRPAPHPVKVFTDFATAEPWVLDQLPAPLREQVPPTQPRSE